MTQEVSINRENRAGSSDTALASFARTQRPRALAGVRVLELAPTPWAALAGQLLGELGADVIRIEPTTGDPLRADEGAFRATCSNRRPMCAP